ncbi:DUF4229 domain-containing protein [Streptomyces sp. NPDC051776]|uniref:DUF4229 domain-containing protein n=1 Tax=Streptomyces sp. NPDC051776 TaxID=3155414 RepID=UPI00341DAE28
MLHWMRYGARARRGHHQPEKKVGPVSTSTSSSGSKQRATLRYTAMRLGVFAGCFLAVWALTYLRVLPSGLGESNFAWVVLLALILSAPLSWVLLRKQRDAMSEQIVEKVDRAKTRLATNQAQEDA